jgi:hypothetical protein
MPFTRSGKHYSMIVKRWCKKCLENTEQQLVGCKYSKTPEPRVPPAFVRTKTWFCTKCEETELEVKEVPEPTDKTRIFNRLLSIQNDYDILGMTIESLLNEIIFRDRRTLRERARQRIFVGEPRSI